MSKEKSSDPRKAVDALYLCLQECYRQGLLTDKAATAAFRGACNALQDWEDGQQ